MSDDTPVTVPGAVPSAAPETGPGLEGIRGFVPTQLPTSPDQGRGIQPPSKIDPKERESVTARTLAITLVIMLGVSYLAQLVALSVLRVYNRLDAIPQFEHMFNVWLPVLAGLVGTAVGFYLKERK